MLRKSSLSLAVILSLTAMPSMAQGPDDQWSSPGKQPKSNKPPSPEFSWFLPKTVLDVSVTYQYTDCFVVAEADGTSQPQLQIKITPLVTARGVADPIPNWRAQAPGELDKIWSDQSFSITTFDNTHILKSVSSHPTSEISAIAGNVLTGVAKIVGIAVGAPLKAAQVALVFPLDKDKGIKVTADNGKCKFPDGGDLAKLAAYKDKLTDTQDKLTSDIDDTTQKKLTAQVTALQTVITALQAKMAFIIKATIDPGVTDPHNVVLGSDTLPPLSVPDAPPNYVAKDKPVATLSPSEDQTRRVPWVGADVALSELILDIYMDFPHGMPAIHLVEKVPNKTGDLVYRATQVGGHTNAISYRDVAYIPVEVWRGGRDPKSPTHLLAAITLPFAQYGKEQVLPLDAKAFTDISWQLTFTELGEETSPTFGSKSTMQAMTSLFSSTASTAGTIATDIRAEKANRATVLQGEADAIYQGNRLQQCQNDPTTCPSK